MKAINLQEIYVTLEKSGEIKTLDGGDKFWRLPADEIEKFGENWLVTSFASDCDWQTWEMHPHAEEFVYLLSGSLDLMLEKDGVVNTIELRNKGLIIVPRGTWHTAKVFEKSDLLIITMGKETQHREV